jgi:crotonobetainyl-CoA:carnitine CoA-transferase CaiB-like acyl-CoA transferase
MATDGPYRDKKAYDLLIQSEAGFVSITGTPDDPCKAGAVDRRHRRRHVRLQQHPAALLQRGIDGRGRRIDLSMLEALGEWMGYPLYYAFDGAAAAAAHRRGARHDLPLRAVPRRRRPDGDARPAERARVAGVLRQGAAPRPALADRRALPRQCAAQRAPRTNCAR